MELASESGQRAGKQSKAAERISFSPALLGSPAAEAPDAMPAAAAAETAAAMPAAACSGATAKGQSTSRCASTSVGFSSANVASTLSSSARVASGDA
eukprot:scaffold87586_cov32-Tisochrysis_lutea.AAC.3